MFSVLLCLILSVISATWAFAVPTRDTTPGKIQNSKHDLNYGFAGNSLTGEICIYCHTPHNAETPVPLWNRKNTSSMFSLYNSPTLTSAAKTSSILSPDSISLFCMTCHDGTVGLGDVINRNIVQSNAYGIVASHGASNPLPIIASSLPGQENPRLGTNLTTTHPVGFDFTTIPTADTGIFPADTIKATFEAKKRPGATSAQDFLYGPNNNMFECASCHRVHDPGTSGNFLRIENGQSQLCLACHNK